MSFTVAELDRVRYDDLNADHTDSVGEGISSSGWGFDATAGIWKPIPVKTVDGNVVLPIAVDSVPTLPSTNLPDIAKGEVAAGATISLLSVDVPDTDLFTLHSWTCGGGNPAMYTLVRREVTGVPQIVEDFESLTGWSDGGKLDALTLSTDNTEGTYAIQADCDFGGKGADEGDMEKSITPTDMSLKSTLSLDVKSDEEVDVELTLSQGGSNYTFATQAASVGAYGTLNFDLSEINNFDKTAVDTININFIKFDEDDVLILVDNMRTLTSVTDTVIDQFYNAEGVHQQIFSPLKTILGTTNTTMVVTVGNDGLTTDNFSATVQRS